MIFFGVKAKQEAQIPLSLHCPSCGERGCLALYIISKSLVLYTFKAFPIETVGIVGCTACETSFMKQEMPPTMLEQTEVHLRQYKTPWLNYIPGIIIAIIIVLAMIQMVTGVNF